MSKWLAFAIVVFVTTFLANVIVVAFWPDSTVEWITSAVIAAATAVALTLVYRRRGDPGAVTRRTGRRNRSELTL